ncbi:MAG: hypothetical protein RR048_03610 [Oscillospiraceae bacterium]
MHRRRIGGLYKGYSLRFNLRNIQYYLVFGVVFILGIYIGKTSLGLVDTSENTTFGLLLSPLNTLSQNPNSQSSFVVFVLEFALVSVIFICGFCAIAQPIVLFVIFYQGLGYGLMAGYILVLEQKFVVLYVVLVLAPKMFMGAVILFLSAKDSIKYSMNYVSVLRGSGDKKNMTMSTTGYCMNFVGYVFLCFVYTGAVAVLCYLYSLII